MGLRLKFNLVLITMFIVGFGGAGAVSDHLLQQSARQEVLKSAGLMMESAVAVRSYTVEQVRPQLNRLPADTFYPQTVPAFAATEVLERLNRHFPDYSYKEAALNPTNPRDRTTEWEADIVEKFQKDSNTTEIVGERDTPTGRQLYKARPIRITQQACLVCHTSVEMAPPAMIRTYGPANGFGWKLNDVIGAQIVSVPMKLPRHNAHEAFVTFMTSLAVVFGLVFIVINLMLDLLIIRPIRKMSAAADRISVGDFSSPEFSESGRDEISILSSSFNRMRRSLEKAMSMLEE